MPAHAIDMSGQRFGRLQVLERAARGGSQARWVCLCDCGETTTVHGGSLRSGDTRSCGCLLRETRGSLSRTHGMRGSTEYALWSAMKRRCNNPNVERYPIYGGRGIKVCERWQKFENFYADMGPRPSPSHSIDRIDGSRGYEPGNVRWAEPREQNNNRRHVQMIEHEGDVRNVCEWARHLGMTDGTVRYHLRKGRTMGWLVAHAVRTGRYHQPQCKH